jgi:hypothetical protein
LPQQLGLSTTQALEGIWFINILFRCAGLPKVYMDDMTLKFSTALSFAFVVVDGFWFSNLLGSRKRSFLSYRRTLANLGRELADRAPLGWQLPLSLD